MKQETIYSLVRAVFMALGAFLIGKTVAHQPVTTELLDSATGIIIALVTTYFGIKGKATTQDQIMATAKQLLVFVGSFVVSSGKMTADAVNTWVGIVTMLLGVFLSKSYKAASAPVVPSVTSSSQVK